MPKRLTLTPSFTSSALNTSTKPPSPPASHIPSTFTDGLPLPKLFVFDLDYTLWPFWVDTHVSSPIKPASKDPASNTAMLDRYGEKFAFYRDVPGILHAARAKGLTMGLASRTCAPDLAEKMLRGIVVPVPTTTSSADGAEGGVVLVEKEKSGKEKPLKAWDYFTYREIYPGSKIKHFNKIQASTTTKSSSAAARRISAAVSGGGGGGGGQEVAFVDMIFFDDEGRNREVETQLGVTFVLVRDGVTRDEVDRGVREWRRRRGIAANGKGSEDGDGERDGGIDL